MASLKEFLGRKLRLKVNETKSAVARAPRRKFLGFSFFMRNGRAELGIAPDSLTRARRRVREITGRSRGVSLPGIVRELNRFTVGWVTYFRYSRSRKRLQELDEGIRRRLRCFRIKQWKNRPSTRYRQMVALGLSQERAAKFAACGDGWWRLSGNPFSTQAMPNAYFAQAGLISLVDRWTQLQHV